MSVYCGFTHVAHGVCAAYTLEIGLHTVFNAFLMICILGKYILSSNEVNKASMPTKVVMGAWSLPQQSQYYIQLGVAINYRFCYSDDKQWSINTHFKVLKVMYKFKDKKFFNSGFS